MSVRQLIDLLVTLIRVIKEQFLGNVDFLHLIKKNPVSTFLVFCNTILFVLIIYMSGRALTLNTKLSQTRDSMEKLQTQFIMIVPPNTPDEQVGVIITQKLYQQHIAHVKCLAELDIATKLLLEYPLTDAEKLKSPRKPSP